jgi:hypothetical protein
MNDEYRSPQIMEESQRIEAGNFRNPGFGQFFLCESMFIRG